MNKKILLLLCCIASLTALAFFDGHQTPYTATGFVTDEKQQPLADVTVAEVGINNQTKTDANGHYSLTVNNAKAVIRFSAIGYEILEITITGDYNKNVVLKKVSPREQEVVAKAYSKVMRSNITGQKIMGATPGISESEEVYRDYERTD